MSDELNDLKAELIQNGVDGRKLRNKSIEELKELLKDHKDASILLDTVSLSPDESVLPISTGDDQHNSNDPTPNDPNWTDYVMSFFDTKELDQKSGMPRVDGLRRITRKLLGEYDMIIQDIPQLPDPSNRGRATAIVQLRFHKDKRVVTDAADAFCGNTLEKFAVHPVAIAVTRAEGRALRKALYLTKILAAEELYGDVKKVEEDQPYSIPQEKENSISESMFNSLLIMCEKLGVDLHRTSVNLGLDIASVEDLTHDQGMKVANQLSLYQRGTVEIPQNIKK